MCSLYLLDRDGTGVTLAATNGLDPEQIGVARLPLGVGITGIVAKTRKPTTSANVHKDSRFHWIRGVDQLKFTSMCSVPLIWNDQVDRRAQRPDRTRRREFTKQDVSFLEALAGLLAGIVERNRLQREAETQIESLRAIDEARAHLVAVVTHALRTPLAVVRAYVELLGGATKRMAGRDRGVGGVGWERNALEQVDRLDQTVDSILASLRVLQSDTRPRHTARRGRGGRRHGARARPDVPEAEARRDLRGAAAAGACVGATCSGGCSATCSRTRRSTRRPKARSTSTAGAPAIACSWPSPTTGRAFPSDWRERIFEPFVRLDDSPRGAGIGLFAARHLARSMSGDLRAEDREPRGSQFVLELPAAR